MTVIRVHDNLAGVSRWRRALFADQIPYATATAINSTAVEGQKDQRRHQRRVFDVRRPTWVDRAVKIKPFANKRRLYADIAIDAPGGRSDILAKFEEGGRKRPRGESIAIPQEARRTKAGVVSRSQRPRAFKFRASKKGGALIGEKRTMLIRDQSGRGVIVQRVGRGRHVTKRVLYALEPVVPIKPVLGLQRNIFAAVRRSFGYHFRGAFERAVRTAR